LDKLEREERRYDKVISDTNRKRGTRLDASLSFYTPIHEVVPRAVSTAEMIDAMICSVHLSVSFFVISYKL
jgi:hypothetical protein